MLERSVSAVDQVIHAIKDGIRDARYAPGQRLVEPELMREVGVSRGSVREALRRLASEGFVEWQRYRGASIIRMSRRQVSEFLDLRELLEGFAARTAAEKIEANGRSSLLKLERTKDARSIIPANYDSYNNEFHALIMDLAGNSELPALLDQIRLPILRLQFNKILLYPGQIRQSREDHNKIVGAILKGAAPLAERAMREHIRHSATCILNSPKAFFA
jgi:DNA-binding GntR family transcriptional regulator